MPFRLTSETYSGAFVTPLDGVASVSVQCMGPGDAAVSLDDDGVTYPLPLPVGTKYDFPYQGSPYQGRLSGKPVNAANPVLMVVIKSFFIC